MPVPPVAGVVTDGVDGTDGVGTLVADPLGVGAADVDVAGPEAGVGGAPLVAPLVGVSVAVPSGPGDVGVVGVVSVVGVVVGVVGVVSVVVVE